MIHTLNSDSSIQLPSMLSEDLQNKTLYLSTLNKLSNCPLNTERIANSLKKRLQLGALRQQKSNELCYVNVLFYS